MRRPKGISIDGLPPKIGPCDECGRMTDGYVGHYCPNVEFFCDDCTTAWLGEGWDAEEARRKKH